MRTEFVATAYVVNQGKLLLIKHTKLGKWLPLGGHVEENETPEEAVLREVIEESGLEAEIVGERLSEGSEEEVEVLFTPDHVQVETLDHGNGLHKHVDFLYLCKAKNNSTQANEEMRWFSEKELESEEIQYNVRFFGKIALQKIR